MMRPRKSRNVYNPSRIIENRNFCAYNIKFERKNDMNTLTYDCKCLHEKAKRKRDELAVRKIQLTCDLRSKPGRQRSRQQSGESRHEAKVAAKRKGSFKAG